MRILIAPTGFKECLSSAEVVTAITRGVLHVVPDAAVHGIPLLDGGEGTAAQLATNTGGALVPTQVTGPLGYPVAAHFALLGGPGPRTAFVEMAAAAGLALVPPDQRNPERTTSRGVGELISAALDAGATRIIVGCGDSGVCDGGAGAVQALGVRVLDHAGENVEPGGGKLPDARRIDKSTMDSRLAETELIVAANPANLLCGVARTYGPQKGATPRQSIALEAALLHWSELLREHSGHDLWKNAGGGGSGGLAAGLAGVFGARLASRFDVLLDDTDLDQRLAESDLVITAEGAIDASTALGKIPAEVARRAKQHGTPVIALAGTIGAGADSSYASGIDAFAGILRAPVELAEAMTHAPELLTDAAARTLRLLLLGRSIAA